MRIFDLKSTPDNISYKILWNRQNIQTKYIKCTIKTFYCTNNVVILKYDTTSKYLWNTPKMKYNYTFHTSIKQSIIKNKYFIWLMIFISLMNINYIIFVIINL